MAAIEIPVQLSSSHCNSDDDGHVFCTPYHSTFITTHTWNIAASTSYLTISTLTQMYTSTQTYTSIQTYTSTSTLPWRTTAEVPTTVSSTSTGMETIREPPEPPETSIFSSSRSAFWPVVFTILGGLLLLGGMIGLCIWTFRRKREGVYPGHQLLNMLARNSTNRSLGAGAALSGDGGLAINIKTRDAVSPTNAPGASGEAPSQALPLSSAPAVVPVVNSIDGVLAGERSESGKANGGEVGSARYA